MKSILFFIFGCISAPNLLQMDFRERFLYDENTDVIGRGGFASVYRAKDIHTDETVAVKVFRERPYDYPVAKDRRRPSIYLNHQNLCRYYDIIKFRDESGQRAEAVVMEYIEGGNIGFYCASHPDQLNKLLVDVLGGIEFLHEHGVIHGDIKPSNVLIKNTSKGPVAKIIDFGVDYSIDGDRLSHGRYIGTKRYLAPEISLPQKYGIKGRVGPNTDYWSFGLMVYDIIAGMNSFGTNLPDRRDLSTQIVNLSTIPVINDAQLAAQINELGEPYRKIVSMCLVPDARLRVKDGTEMVRILRDSTKNDLFLKPSKLLPEQPTEPAASTNDLPARNIFSESVEISGDFHLGDGGGPSEYHNTDNAHDRNAEKFIIHVGSGDIIASNKIVNSYNYLSSREDTEGNVIVDVFYATDRKKETGTHEITFSGERGDLSYGICKVNIPKHKKVGAVPRPGWWKCQFKESKDKHVMVLDIQELDKNVFFYHVAEKVDASTDHDAFVFIHGYNVSFTDSVMRTAQMAFDLGFKGAPIVYSWPSKAGTADYLGDEDNVKFTVNHVISFLKQLRQESKAKKIHLIAHSMGNRALADALIQLKSDKFFKSFAFNQIILAAPDIDAQIFAQNIAPQIAASSRRITLYTSSKDFALTASKKIRRSMIPRLGLSGSKIVIIKGIDTVDASNVSTELMGHSYFADSPNLINDIYHLTKHNHSPEERNLKKIIANDMVYWEFKK